jgi:cation:H+ antiporter
VRKLALEFVYNFAATYPFWFHIILIVASLALMSKAADLLVFGITDYAKKLGFSDYLIGLIIISIGASVPELVSSAMGMIAGEATIIFGTILGSCIGGLTIVLGILAIIGGKLKTNKKVLNKTGPIIFGLSMIPIIMMINGVLSRAEGIILICIYLGYNYYIYKKEGEMGKFKKSVRMKILYRDMFIAIGALVAIILSGRYLVFSSIEVARMFAMSPYIIAITIISVATQVPDLAVSLRAVRRGHQDIALADVLGSTVTKLLLFFGIFAIITPLQMNPKTLIFAMIFMALSLGGALLFARKGYLDRKHGIILLSMFVVFIALQLLFA